ncbi:hypothetical protein EVG20_g913 [Dentipellis fragilis]|uniref:BCD1 alpha/beta domain-containing protein n=1 Tax=Dentipellis fragilis TaxID=205917 RepID=A0A4Y9ZC18_9AGAM|nr:hypothetical protein EVG20_g913 [Dentipellis fragilis]
MNQYGLGTLMDDYVFLEEMGRKVTDWGKEIVKGGFGAGSERGAGAMGGRGRGRGRGSGRGRERGRGTGQKTKRDVLKMQLEARDVDVDMLPAGMQRRTHNQSTWDFKNKTALLTIEFKCHPPSGEPQSAPYTLLTHRNNVDNALLTLAQSQIKERAKAKRDNAIPAWVRSLVLPDADVPDSFTPPCFFMPTTLDPLTNLSNTGHYQLDGTLPLLTSLRHKQFVEFPTIEIWEEGAFRGVVVDAQGGVRREEDERPAKRKRLNAAAGKKAIDGLLGAYGSEEEEEIEVVMDVLEGYAGSDQDEGEGDDAVEEDNGDEIGDVDEDAVEMGEAEISAVDYAALLDLIRQQKDRDGGDGEEVDWSDSASGI